MDRLTAEELADYLIEIGGTLVSYGCPSYRLEALVALVAEHEGLKAQAFAMPTGLFVSVTDTDMTPLPSERHPDVGSLPPPRIAPILRMVRVKEWGTNLDRLVAVDEIFNDAADKKISIREARRRLHALRRAPNAYPVALSWIASAVAAGAAAVFFRGGAFEVAVSALTGLVAFGFAQAIGKNPSARFLIDFVGGVIAAAMAWGASRVHADASREVIVLSGVIAVIPGMTLTTGLAELAQRNLVAGGARLMEAFVAFLSIIFGIALLLGFQHIAGVSPSYAASTRHGLGLGWQAGALVAASLAFAVLFAVPRRYVWAAVVSGAIGYVATSLGTRHLPGHVAAFAAALAICLFSNASARATNRPAQMFQLPGMMLLVPGSFGFLSLEDFLRGAYLDGAAKAFSMILIAGALVTGVLVANVVLPARKVL